MLAALQAKLGVGNAAVFKAGSALAGGVVSRGESCGALTGAIMAICCLVGRERLEDLAQYQKAKTPATEMYLRFREEVGHTICAEIHKLRFGRAFRLYEPAELKAFREAGGSSRTGCPDICGIAARTAADIILRLQEGATA